MPFFSYPPLSVCDLVSLLPWIPTGPVLCLGYNSYDFALVFVEYGFSVTLVDYDMKKIELGRQKQGAFINWVCEDIRQMRLPRNHYAALIAPNILTFIPNGERARLIGRFKSTIKYQGCVLLGGIASEHPSAQLKLARDLQQITHWPTGTTSVEELKDRFSDWEVLSTCRQEKEQKVLLMGKKTIGHCFASKAWNRLPPIGLGLPMHRSQNELSSFLPSANHLQVPLNLYGEPEHDLYLNHLKARYSLVALSHGLGKSYLEPDSIDSELKRLERIVQRTQTPWLVEIMGFLPSPSSLAPVAMALPRSQKTLDTIFHYLNQIQKKVGCAVLLKNQAPLFEIEHELSWDVFWGQLEQKNKCAFDLDILHFFLAAKRLKTTPLELLDSFPKQRIVQLSLSCSAFEARLLPIDNHHFWGQVWDFIEVIRSLKSMKSFVYDLPPQIIKPDYLWDDCLRIGKKLKETSDS